MELLLVQLATLQAMKLIIHLLIMSLLILVKAKRKINKRER